MIKLLLPLLLLIPLYSQENTYIFPDNHSRFVHEIGQLIKKSSSVTVITEHYHHASLSKALINSAKKGTAIKLIVHNPQGEPLSLIQYQNIDLYLSSVPLPKTVILIDDTIACNGSTPIEEDHFSAQHLSLRCTDSVDTISALRHSLQPILHVSKRYLE